MAAHTTARQRAREAVVGEIKTEARKQLADAGAAGLSLRAVARELGMVSSAIYRYFPSRDELLTALIVDAYRDLAVAAERAVDRAGDQPREIWRAACGAIRAWARRRPHEYALLYGSPVPGYAAPEDTIDPATAVYRALAEAVRRSGRRPSKGARPLVAGLAVDAQRVVEALELDADPERAVTLLGAWAQVFGLVSLELFGHTNGVVEDHDGFFGERVEAMADELAL
jgi:AcrR family transcriptional regulator